MIDLTDALGSFLDGKSYTLDGVSGFFRYLTRRATYPYPHTIREIIHEADSRGLRSEVYRAQREQLGDDWVTDLTNSEALCEIALELGFDFNEEVLDGEAIGDHGALTGAPLIQ